MIIFRITSLWFIVITIINYFCVEPKTNTFYWFMKSLRLWPFNVREHGKLIIFRRLYILFSFVTEAVVYFFPSYYSIVFCFMQSYCLFNVVVSQDLNLRNTTKTIYLTSKKLHKMEIKRWSLGF